MYYYTVTVLSTETHSQLIFSYQKLHLILKVGKFDLHYLTEKEIIIINYYAFLSFFFFHRYTPARISEDWKLNILRNILRYV